MTHIFTLERRPDAHDIWGRADVLDLFADQQLLICDAQLRRFFIIPRRVTRLYLHLSTTPVRGAVLVRRSERRYRPVQPRLQPLPALVAGRRVSLTPSAARHLDRLGGRAWAWLEYDA